MTITERGKKPCTRNKYCIKMHETFHLELKCPSQGNILTYVHLL